MCGALHDLAGVRQPLGGVLRSRQRIAQGRQRVGLRRIVARQAGESQRFVRQRKAPFVRVDHRRGHGQARQHERAEHQVLCG